MLYLVLYASLAVCISFLCSLLEAALLSTSTTYIGILKKQGKKTGYRLEKLKQNIDKPLAAILSLNTIANTVGSAGVGAQVLKVFGSQALALSSFLLTFTILICSEIIPKTLGSRYCRALAPFTVVAVNFLILITYPIVWLLQKITLLIPKRSEDDLASLQRAEVIITAEMGEDDGSLQTKESEVIRNLINMDQVTVKEVMTPRTALFSLVKSLTVAQVMEQYPELKHSRIPIYTENHDEIVGMVHRYMIMDHYAKGNKQITLDEIKTTLYSVAQSISISNVLNLFFKLKQHAFLALDDYASTSGLISLEDAVETLLGEDIIDEFDQIEQEHHLLKTDPKQPNKLIIKKREE